MGARTLSAGGLTRALCAAFVLLAVAASASSDVAGRKVLATKAPPPKKPTPKSPPPKKQAPPSPAPAPARRVRGSLSSFSAKRTGTPKAGGKIGSGSCTPGNIVVTSPAVCKFTMVSTGGPFGIKMPKFTCTPGSKTCVSATPAQINVVDKIKAIINPLDPRSAVPVLANLSAIAQKVAALRCKGSSIFCAYKAAAVDQALAAQSDPAIAYQAFANSISLDLKALNSTEVAERASNLADAAAAVVDINNATAAATFMVGINSYSDLAPTELSYLAGVFSQDTNATALPPLLVDDSAGARRRSMRKLLQTSTVWTPTSADKFRPGNATAGTLYPAFWDWRSCKVATSNSAGCYTGAVSGGVTTGSSAGTNVSFVTAVRDQGLCASCWAMATASTIESVMAIEGALTPGRQLSTQALKNCYTDFYGCDGGDRPVYSNIWSKGGLLLDTSMPYNIGDSTCPSNFNGQTNAATNLGLRNNEVTTSTAVNLADGNQLFLALKTKGPLSITIWSDNNPGFQLYKSGIYTNTYTSSRPTGQEDHAITLVGWGEETIGGVTYPYWIIKNSWGTSWGENGYVRMARKRWTTNPYNEGGSNFVWEGIYSASYVTFVNA